MNKGIVDSYIYAKDIMNFDNFNADAHIINSTIITDNNLNFKNFNANILGDTLIYSGDRINLNYNMDPSDFKGNIASTAFMCSAGPIAKGFKDKATNGNVVEYVTLEKCLELAGKKLTKETDKVKDSSLSDFYIELEKSVNEANYQYN